ncbi:MAG: hypothetical protein ACLFMP_07655, partial [Desulfonatronovibrionaceae bacterium]
FISYCAAHSRPEEVGLNTLKKTSAYRPEPSRLVISCTHISQGEILKKNGKYEKLQKLCRDFFGPDTELELELPEKKEFPSKNELREKALQHPGVKKVLQRFNARVLDVRSLENNY